MSKLDFTNEMSSLRVIASSIEKNICQAMKEKGINVLNLKRVDNHDLDTIYGYGYYGEYDELREVVVVGLVLEKNDSLSTVVMPTTEYNSEYGYGNDIIPDEDFSELVKDTDYHTFSIMNGDVLIGLYTMFNIGESIHEYI